MVGVLWLRSVLFTVLVPGSVLVWVPWWLSTLWGGSLDLGAVRWVGVPLLAAGVAGLLWCIWDFGRVGGGTLAPVDPPRFVVRGGLYEVVRNPMYLSVLSALGGQALLFQSSVLVGWAAVVAVAVHLFVVVYEEPGLRRRFGADYEAYCRAVRRWRPRYPGGDGPVVVSTSGRSR